MRYEKTVDGETINHVWDGNQQIVADVIDNQFYEADCYIRGTNLVAKYNYWNGDKSEYTYYTQNAHGDVVNLTDKDGKVTKSYKYDAFGVEKNIYENDTNAFRYCGEYYDKETATVYLRARNYNPSTGRFTQRDSYAGRRTDPLSLNLYTYCANNPVYFFDPSGYSYGTLPDGTKMSINSAWDAKKFNELRDKQLSTEVNAKKNTYADSNDAFGLNKQQQEANAEYIYNYLSNEGWSINAICGLLGNIQQESQMNPGSWQIGFEDNKSSSNCGYGLIQFTPAEDFLPKIGFSIDNIDEYAERKPGELIDLQLKYLISSCQPDQYVWLSEMGVNIYGSPYEMAFDEFITSSNSPGELALVFHGHYERSADDEFTQNNRVEYANYWYNYFNN
ncbi:MAG: phage tail tip lysozyme [Oscillospiraceae bacterium]